MTGSPFIRAGKILGGLLIITALVAGIWLYVTRQPGGVMWLLVDSSPSVQRSRQAITDCADQAIDGAIEDGMSIVIAPVTSSPAYDQPNPIATHLTLIDRLTPTKSPAIQASARIRARDQLHRILTGLPFPEGSNIIAATATAATSLVRDHGHKVLIVCTDGHVVDPPVVDAYTDTLGPARDGAIMRRLGSELVPLRGVYVAFGATGADLRDPLVEPREQLITQLWQLWADDVSAKSFTYGPTLSWPQL